MGEREQSAEGTLLDVATSQPRRTEVLIVDAEPVGGGSSSEVSAISSMSSVMSTDSEEAVVVAPESNMPPASPDRCVTPTPPPLVQDEDVSTAGGDESREVPATVKLGAAASWDNVLHADAAADAARPLQPAGAAPPTSAETQSMTSLSWRGGTGGMTSYRVGGDGGGWAARGRGYPVRGGGGYGYGYGAPPPRSSRSGYLYSNNQPLQQPAGGYQHYRSYSNMNMARNSSATSLYGHHGQYGARPGSPNPFGIKHPLERKWSFWFYQMNSNRDWEENLLPITSFDTIEDFWANFSYILPPSRLHHGCDYAVFKYGIKPMWEDTMNCKGGRWMISLPRKHRTNYLDWMWLESLLCLIGETFEEQSGDICGTVVSIRPRMDRISVWTNDARRAECNVRIAQKWKERLGIPSNHPLAYEAHQDCLAKLDDPGAARVLYTA